jgi:predicted enzyme related to lactoylglutathione lyase
MIGRLGWVQIDCADPEALSKFWAAVLGVEEFGREGDPPQYISLRSNVEGGPRVVFQRVPETKQVKNRLHLDIAVDDIDAACAAAEALGARRADGQDFELSDMAWRVMLDPEGNEFCLVKS